MDWIHARRAAFELLLVFAVLTFFTWMFTGCASFTENRISTEEFNPETGQVYRDEVYQKSKAGPMAEVLPLQDASWDFATGLRLQQQGTLNNTAQVEAFNLIEDVIGATVKAVLEAMGAVPAPVEVVE